MAGKGRIAETTAVNVAGGPSQPLLGDRLGAWLQSSWEAGFHWLRHRLEAVFGPPRKTASIVTVVLSAASGKTVTVNFATQEQNPVSATSGTDFNSSSGTLTYSPGKTSKTFTVSTVQDFAQESDEALNLVLSSPSNATLGLSSAVLTIVDDDKSFTGMPPPVPADCGCGDPVAIATAAAGMPSAAPSGTSGHPVRYADGVVKFTSTDLETFGFGEPFGALRSWSNGTGYTATSWNGNGWVSEQQPYLQQANGDDAHVVLVTSGTASRYFDQAAVDYTERFYGVDRLTHDTTNHLFTLTDPAGNVFKFYDFTSNWQTYQKGQFESYSDPNSNTISVTSHTSDGKITEVQRSYTSGGVTTIESLLTTYISSGTNVGLISNIALRRKVGAGSWTSVRQADFDYYGSSESYGNAGDLRHAYIKDGSGSNTLETKYYRYFTNTTNGYVHALKMVFEGASYDRLAAAYSDPTTATDTHVSPFADYQFQFDSSTHRATQETVSGAGNAGSGQGTFSFSWTDSSNTPDPNRWSRRSVENLPSGDQNVVYTNYAGQVLLSVFKDTTTNDQWITYYQYDTSGRLVLEAFPSAVSGYDDSYSDLLHNQSGNYQYLRDSAGLIQSWVYGSSTTATSSTAGDVVGYLKDVRVQQGEGGTPILQERTQYISRSAGTTTIYVTASDTVYRNTDATGAETTAYSYSWVSGTVQIESKTTTLPTVTTAQNGPNSADTSTVFFNAYAQPVWTKDGDGLLNYTEYDTVTGAVTKTITDVDTTQTGDFSGLPSGWSTPSGGGLHLITLYQVDSLGRTVKVTDPAGKITYTVYNDANHETRTYPGWDATNHVPTGPTQVTRQDLDGGYSETLTMTAGPALDGSNLPTGTESISGIQTLSRTYTNDAGEVIYDDRYFSLAGLTYSTSTSLGTENTNFYRTRYGYDNMGRLARTQLPTGTIQRTVYDSIGRVASTWIGTNDTPSSGDWSPTNNSSPANMVKVSENEYDNGGVGDGNLTKVTQIPGGSAANRVTQYYFDWRDRAVATKSGVEASESTSLNRPIYYTEYDNLGEAIAQEQYDGDNVTISDSNSDGVPDKPSSSLRRARTVNNFDEQQRVFRTEVYSVNQSDGSLSSSTLKVDHWFDHRGNEIKTVQPRGLVSKMKFDVAGRETKVYTTDGGGDSAWSDADDVSGDAVLEQVENTFDADGNVILTTSKQRFHDETSTGELANASTAPKARVSYVAQYYDAANRLTATVNVGTNGGSTYTRPSTAPGRSDTGLVTSYTYTYNVAGWVDTVTDPRGIGSLTLYDNLGQTTKFIEAYYYPGTTPTNNTNRTTEYTHSGRATTKEGRWLGWRRLASCDRSVVRSWMGR